MAKLKASGAKSARSFTPAESAVNQQSNDGSNAQTWIALHLPSGTTFMIPELEYLQIKADITKLLKDLATQCTNQAWIKRLNRIISVTSPNRKKNSKRQSETGWQNTRSTKC